MARPYNATPQTFTHFYERRDAAYAARTYFTPTGALAGDTFGIGTFQGTAYNAQLKTVGPDHWAIQLQAPINTYQSFNEVWPLGGPTPVPPGATRRLILGIGQSNEVGQGDVGQLPAGFPSNGNRIWLYNNNAAWIQDPQEPIGADVAFPVDAVLNVNPAAGVGPMDQMANEVVAGLASAVDEVGIVQAGLGGSSSTAWLSNTSRSSLFGAAVAHAIAARELDGTRLDGVVLYQGEADATGGAPTWDTNWSLTIAAMRAALGDPNLFFWVVQLPPTAPAAHPGWATVRAQQAALVSGTVNTALVPAPDGPWTDAQIHLATSAQLQLGAALAAAYLTEFP